MLSAPRLPHVPLLCALLVLFSGLLAGQAQARNESRWFLQNVCLASAVKLMGDESWKRFHKEAKAARGRLKSRGVPEAHLREMEDFAIKIINSTTTEENIESGPQLCIQWYKT